MQVADGRGSGHADGKATKKRSGSTDLIVVPEVEAIRTEALLELEASGVNVIPSANAAHQTMNRTPSVRWPPTDCPPLGTYASSEAELIGCTSNVGLPV